jgi:GxxExxY protein
MTTGWFAYNMIVNGHRDQERMEYEHRQIQRPQEELTWQPMEYTPYASGAAPMELRPTADAIVSAANEVYSFLGAGHSEAVYEEALAIELKLRGFDDVRTQVPHSISYKGRPVGVGYIDIVAGKRYIIELKTVAKLTSKDEAQVARYRTNTLQTCLLVNFNPSSGEVEVREIGVDSRESRNRDRPLLQEQGDTQPNSGCDYNPQSPTERCPHCMEY